MLPALAFAGFENPNPTCRGACGSFFDNEEDNIDEVSQLGVKCVYCPRGMDEPSWEKGVRLFAGAGARA